MNGQWLDDDIPSAAWAAPVTPFRVPVWVRWVIALLLVALVAGLMVRFNGFGHRQDEVLTRAPGTVLEIGPMEITFDYVISQRVQDYEDKWVWKTTLVGTVRNTWDESVSFRGTEFGWVAVREPISKEIQSPDGMDVSTSALETLPPGGAPVAFELKMDFEKEPHRYMQVHMLDLEYTDNSLLGFGERTWNPADYLYETWVPVTRLPDQPYDW